MKLLTFPIRVLTRLLVRLVVLPIKLVLATAGLTFRAGFKVGTLPVKGGVVAGRRLGLKALLLFAAGIALGVVVGRRLGAAGAELAGASYDDGVGAFDGGVSGLGGEPVVTLVEDTIEVIDTPDGPVVTETVSVTELDEAAVEEAIEEIEAAELQAEVASELDVEAVSEALGETGGEVGEDPESGSTGGADV